MTVERALAVAAAGLPVFPCNPENKSPLTKRGFHDASHSPDQIRQWWAAHPDALVGVPTGKPSKLLVIDFDATPEAEAWRLVNDSAGARVHKTRRGEHWLYALDDADDVRCGTNVLAPGIDVRANGGYVIWWPAHDLPFEGPSALAVPPAPEHVRAGLKRGDDEAMPATPQTLDPEMVKRALPAFDPDAGYDEWVRVGMAVHSASGGAKWGFDLWNEWSQGSPKYDSSKMRGHWKSFKADGGIGAGLLLQHSTAAPEDFELLVEAPKPSPLSCVDELPDVRPIEWIVDGFIPRCESFALYGLPKSGKSYALLDMALAVSRGIEWQGHGTKQGVVVWVTAEGNASTRRRIEAYKRREKCTLPGMFIYNAAPQLARQDDVKALVDAVKPLQPALILIDALIGVTRGLDENDRKVGEVLQRAASLLYAETGATVGVIHHAGKDASKGMRGSTAILGVIEASLRIRKDDGTHTLLLEEGRDVEGGEAFRFTMEEDDVGGVMFHPAGAPVKLVTKPRGPNQQQIYDILSSGPMTLLALETAFKAWAVEQAKGKGSPDPADTALNAWRNGAKAIRQAAWCTIDGDMISLTEYV